jgi:hypothetical protein
MFGFQYLPASLWVIITGISLILVIISLGVYFWYRARVDAFNNGEKTVAGLAARENILKAEIEQSLKYRDRVQEELLKLENQRQEQLKLEEELAELQTKLAQGEQKADELRKEAIDLQNVVSSLTKDRDRFETEKVDLDNKRDAANEKAKTAEAFKVQALIKTKEAQKDLEEKRVEIKELNNKVTDQTLKKDSLVEEINDKKSKLDKLNQDLKNAESENQHISKASHEEKQRLEQISDKLSEVKQELKDTKEELAIQERFEKEAALKVQKLNLEVDRLKSEEIALKSSIKSLEVLSKQLSKQLDAQEGDATASEEKYRDLWNPVPFPELPPADGSADEKQLLKNVADYIKGQNLYFPERVLYAFHTALKIGDISPLVVLAGISGTGKSELPRRYAEGMGLHFVILPVQPRWDSPQDLFGFYNYLEKRYKATELARAMVQFELYNQSLWPLPTNWDYSRSDRMLLVLLDEMNLARVEYYFSEFLSRLETRRGINQEDKNERAKAEIALEMGSLHQGEKSILLFPGQNILFAGTMNEDETTQALSDKVLDRACVMRFGRPKEIIGNSNEPKRSPTKNGLTFAQWRSWQKEKNSPAEEAQIDEWINELNNAMDEISRPFGHRVAQAIQSYVANYPAWVTDRIKKAMADQIEQRIMPKLRGIEIADAGGPIHRIQSIIDDCDDQPLLNAFKQGSSNQQIFIWRGIDRTE